MAKDTSAPTDFIKPLDMNGLAGRMLRLPPPGKKTGEILFVYGQHSSLEQCWDMLKYFNRYAGVTAPDLPGFGGMESFYKIGKKPTLDNFADYLASLVKLRYKRKQLAIVGVSFGFVVATRMLQRYPELAERVKLLVSLDGFAHADDFTFSRRQLMTYRAVAGICSHWLPATVIRYTGLNRRMLKYLYDKLPGAKQQHDSGLSLEQQQQMLADDSNLWHINDVRTHAATWSELLTLDNCRQQLHIPLWHFALTANGSVDAHRTEQHLHVAFGKVSTEANRQKSRSSRLASENPELSALVPAKLRRIISRL